MNDTPRTARLDRGATMSSGPEWLRDIRAALRRGDAQAAPEAGRDAFLAEPARGKALYAFGQAWKAAGAKLKCGAPSPTPSWRRLFISNLVEARLSRAESKANRNAGTY